jgi:Lrp/AsnC family transcriptional regulator, regulator for asnA, asnC and gidA
LPNAKLLFIILPMIGKDSIDEKIIRLLSKNARQSSLELAKQLHISASTVRSRLRRLIRNETLHFIIAVDPFKAGLPVIAQILLDVEQDKIEQTLEKLVTFPEISYVSSTTGRFDIIVFAWFASHHDLAIFLQNQLGKMEGVRDSETLICLDIKKGQFLPVQ